MFVPLVICYLVCNMNNDCCLCDLVFVILICYAIILIIYLHPLLFYWMYFLYLC
jgi:hypothetical protein